MDEYRVASMTSELFPNDLALSDAVQIVVSCND